MRIGMGIGVDLSGASGIGVSLVDVEPGPLLNQDGTPLLNQDDTPLENDAAP